MKKQIILIAALLLSTNLFANEWRDHIDALSKKIVLIEYFEPINSAESIKDREKIKRNLMGLLVSKDGLILTSSSIFKAPMEFNASSHLYTPHQMPTQIRVQIGGSELIPAEFIGKDDDLGLAFIQVSSQKKIDYIQFSSKSKRRLGQKIILMQLMGKNNHFSLMVSERIINAIVKKPLQKLLCEPSVNTLSSFGLVIDETGAPLGVTVDSPNSAPFTAPHFKMEKTLVTILPQASFSKLIASPPAFKEKKNNRKKWLGIYMQPYSRKFAKYHQQERLHGLLINTVIKDSPAWNSGLKVGDIITKVNELSLKAEKDSDLDEFIEYIRNYEQDSAFFHIYRDGTKHILTVQLSAIPISQFLADEASNPALGFSVKELTQDFIIAQQLELDAQGVWVSKVEQAGWADIAGLQHSDLILKMNDHPISELNDVHKIFKIIHQNQPQYIRIFIKRRGETKFLFLKTNF
jgi:serine protease Do